MSIGSSGRIVIEVEPSAKRELYAALARDGLTLKDWFLKSAESYLAQGHQLSLSLRQEKNDVAVTQLKEPKKMVPSGEKS